MIDKDIENLLRVEFEKQHAGRNLLRHRLRGTYSAAPIAALWNQHVKTYMWTTQRHTAKLIALADTIQEKHSDSSLIIKIINDTIYKL